MADGQLKEVSASDLTGIHRLRKRKINMSQWKDNHRKKLRDAGQVHESRKGKHVDKINPPKQARVCHPDVCFKQGCEKLSLQEKISLFEKYYSVSYDEQSAILITAVEMYEPTRRKKGKTDATSRRKCSYRYHIPLSTQTYDICQKTLLDIYSITQRRIQTLQSKLKKGTLIAIDQRGKHKNRPHVISGSVKDSVRKHISSFPNKPRHHSRGKSEKECIKPELTLSRMFKLYKAKFPDTNVKRQLYEEIFVNDFKLQFGTANCRSDTCKYCEKLFRKLMQAKNKKERHTIETQSQKHHAKSEQTCPRLQADKESASKTTVL